MSRERQREQPHATVKIERTLTRRVRKCKVDQWSKQRRIDLKKCFSVVPVNLTTNGQTQFSRLKLRKRWRKRDANFTSNHIQMLQAGRKLIPCNLPNRFELSL